MESNLYWISTIIYAFVLGVVLLNDIKIMDKPDKVEKSFRAMVFWVIFFCAQDTFWGMCQSKTIKGDTAFFIASTIFHLSTVITTFFWLNYVLVFLGKKTRSRCIYLSIYGVAILLETFLVIINFFKPTLFYIKDGVYYTAPLRYMTFINQWVVYIGIGLIALLWTVKSDRENRKRYLSVLSFSLAPIFFCILQLLVVEAPFYSVGYFLGCFVIYILVVSKDREAAIEHLSTLDELTGVGNRRALEDDFRGIKDQPVDEDFVLISMDVNGLKVVNDTIGHAGGDELICGAAACMKQAFEPYGKIYRSGGDEFIAVIHANNLQLEQIKRDFDDIIARWRGELIDSLSISYGYVTKSEINPPTYNEMSLLADQRMYDMKEKYYRTMGVDRRGQRDAHTVLCSLYTKIIKINLTDLSCQIINMEDIEKTRETGFSENFIEWFHNFASSGLIYEDDVEVFLKKTEPEYIKSYFASGKTYLYVFYRRKINGVFKQVMMEIVPANDYSSDNQSFFLYVKDIDS